ncbi:MAG TPA: hypothetical protein ENI73_10350 [Spirochaetes bacterium]|nr:hypothetical protein [Spirochaetota bacterium]
MKISLYLIFLVILTLSVFGGQDSFLKGKYTLYLPNTDSWQHHSITINKVSTRWIKGIIKLDFSIGPQAKEPSPWEILHSIPFRANYDHETKKLTFSVKVNLLRPHKYHFRGYFLDSNDFKGIVGIYKINGKEVGGFLAQRKTK